MFGKKENQVQDKQLQDLWKFVTNLDKNTAAWIKHFDTRLTNIEKKQGETLSYLNTKDAKDKQQDTQITDFVNQFNNALSDLKAKAHEHTVTTETKP